MRQGEVGSEREEGAGGGGGRQGGRGGGRGVGEGRAGVDGGEGG